MNRCKDCKFRTEGGYCISEYLGEGYPDYHAEPDKMLLYSYDEDGSFGLVRILDVYIGIKKLD